MYKLVIVDDEPAVRHGLRTYIDWGTWNIEIAGEAEDGEAALEVISQVQPDIVLTDVLMPEMDGIQLSREIGKRFQIIFVSGHDDVDYLKSALQMNAVDYIFKPVNLQELKSVVERVAGCLQLEAYERKRFNEMKVKLAQSMPLLREKFLLSMIRDGVPQPARIRSRLDFLELNLPEHASYWVLVVRIDSGSEIVESRSEKEIQLLSYAILNIFQELIDRHVNGYAFENQNTEYVGIVWMEAEACKEDSFFELAKELQASLRKWLKIGVTIGLGNKVIQLTDMPYSYRQAREAADQRWSHARGHDYREQLMRYYQYFHERNMTVDLVSPTAELSDYDLVVIPNLMMTADHVVERIYQYVRSGGHVVMDFRAGAKDDSNRMLPRKLPGPFAELLGIEIEEYGVIAPDRPIRIRALGGVGELQDGQVQTKMADWQARTWYEVITAKAAVPLAVYDEQYIAGTPAITRHTFGKGIAIYIGTQLNDTAMSGVMDEVCRERGIKPALPGLPPGVEAVCRSAPGKRYFVVMNHREDAASIPLANPYTNVLSGEEVSGVVTMPPQGVLVLAAAADDQA